MAEGDVLSDGSIELGNVPDEHFQPYFTQSFRKSYVCAKCDHHFKEGDGGGLIGGVAYCERHGCYEEEMYERQRSRRKRR